jgi:predicted GH43/DUF377 family glycosyl hydrolase
MAGLSSSRLIRVFSDEELIPAAWRAPGMTPYVFNPALTLFKGSRLMCYRVVIDGRRRFAICRLDAKLDVIPGSIVPLSDELGTPETWLADPRFVAVADRLFVHFNTGARRNEPNSIYLVEIDPDTLAGKSPARPLVLDTKRQLHEKNWMLFSQGEELFAVYWIAPHTVYRVIIDGAGPVRGYRRYHVDWDVGPYREKFGPPRGGTPPVKIDQTWFSFTHSVRPMSSARKALRKIFKRRIRANLRYEVGFYGFSSAPPFKPRLFSPFPILSSPPLKKTKKPRLSRVIGRCLYPSGAIFDENEWLISYGFQDQYCCISRVSHAKLLQHAIRVA